MSDEGLRLDNPILVGWEFASEERLDKRSSIYHELVEGVRADDVIFQAVLEAAPKRVLEVGSGIGAMAERLRRELGAEVVAIDASSRMVHLTRERGVDARIGDVQRLDFDDDEFDCIVAGWVFYHVADRNRAICGVRACAPPGRPTRRSHARDEQPRRALAVARRRSRARDLLERRQWRRPARTAFRECRATRRERHRRVSHSVEMRSYVAANITRAHLAAQVPDFTEPVRVSAHYAIFVAENPE